MILVQNYPSKEFPIYIEYINEDFARMQKDQFTSGAWKIKTKKV